MSFLKNINRVYNEGEISNDEMIRSLDFRKR